VSPNYVRGEGSLTAKLMIIAEAPGEVEDTSGRPLIGPTGDILNELLKEAGIQRDECYVTNVVKYRPPNNDFKRLHEIGITLQESIDNLWIEIRSVKPNCILALGEKALLATTNKQGINNYRGSILLSKDKNSKVVPTFHPSNLIYQRKRKGSAGLFKYAWKYVMIADMKRALEQSRFPEYNPPRRTLKIARNSLDLYRFLREYDDTKPSTCDIESINSLPVCVGISFNKEEAISVPLYSRFSGIKFSDSHITDRVETWRLLADHLSKAKIIGHNFKYDDEKLFRLGLRPYSGTIFADTLSLEHTLNPELPSKKLYVVSSIRTEEPYYKDEGSEYHPEKDDIERLLLYNARDCVVTFEVWEDQDAELKELSEKYSSQIYEFYYEFVTKLHNFYLEMERTGFRTDLHIRHRLNQKYTAWHNKIQRWFKSNAGKELNVYSYKTLFHYIYSELGCPLRKDTGEDTLVQLMTNVIKDDYRKNILSNILDDRRVRKAKSTYINADLDYDNRLRTSFFVTGTETGRSTTNLLENPIRPKGHSVGIAFQTITKHGDIGADVRRMLIPDNGYVFLSCDLSQAEARIVSVLCEDWELLRAFDTVDIHRRTAGLVFDYVSNIELGIICSNLDVDKLGKDSGERFLGKKTRHAGNYNMGPERHHADAHSEARRAGIKLDLSEYKAKRNLEKFHECSPKIRGIFHRDIQFWINKQRYLVNPYGRIRFFLDRLGEEMYREAYAFIPQSTVHDTLTLGGIRIKEELQGIRFLKEDHDSFTVLAPRGEVEDIARVMKRHIEIPIDFNNCTLKKDIKLIIPSDFEIGEKNYKDMERLKI
jgi:uracil-DNA glycosylase family 4